MVCKLHDGLCVSDDTLYWHQLNVVSQSTCKQSTPCGPKIGNAAIASLRTDVTWESILAECEPKWNKTALDVMSNHFLSPMEYRTIIIAFSTWPVEDRTNLYKRIVSSRNFPRVLNPSWERANKEAGIFKLSFLNPDYIAKWGRPGIPIDQIYQWLLLPEGSMEERRNFWKILKNIVINEGLGGNQAFRGLAGRGIPEDALGIVSGFLRGEKPPGSGALRWPNRTPRSGGRRRKTHKKHTRT